MQRCSRVYEFLWVLVLAAGWRQTSSRFAILMRCWILAKRPERPFRVFVAAWRHRSFIPGILSAFSRCTQTKIARSARITSEFSMGSRRRSAEAIATIGNVAVVVAPPSKSALVYISLQEEDEPARFDKAVEGLLERLRRSVRTYDSIERPHNYEVIAILRGPNATSVLAAATRLEITAKDYWAKTGEPSFRAIDVLSSPVSQSEGDLTLLRRARSRFGQDGARSDDGPESKIIH